MLSTLRLYTDTPALLRCSTKLDSYIFWGIGSWNTPLTTHNLSRFSSAKGLREELQFKIGYETTKAQVERMIAIAEKEVVANHDIAVEGKFPMEIRATDAGDFAITWSIFYYTKKMSALLKTKQDIRCAVINAARKSNINLATPVLHDVMVSREKSKEPGYPNKNGHSILN